MFEKILVAVDLSSVGESVFEKGLSMAKLCQANLMLLHVLSQDEQGGPVVEGMAGLNYYEMVELETLKTYQKQWQQYAERGLETLETYREKATEAGVSCQYSQPVGKPGRLICQEAEGWGANLIVMGHRGVSGLSEFFLGSVSNYVLHHARCSVLIVQLPRKSE